MNYYSFAILGILAVCSANILLLVYCKQASNVFKSRPETATFGWWPWRK